MKIFFFTAGPEILASSRTRAYQYLPYLKQAGIGFRVVNFNSRDECRAMMTKTERTLIKKLFDKIYSFFQVLKLLFFAKNYDIVFIQKVLLPGFVLDLLFFLNNHIVFDFDDALFVNAKFIKRFTHTVRKSKCVILENDFNRDFVQRYNKNILTITGPIDTKRYFLYKKNEDNGHVTIGWIGSQDSAHYVKPLLEVFRNLSKICKNLKIEIIGAGEINVEGLNLITKDWQLEAEIQDLHKFDIGVMPLPDDEWSKGKGGYKLLQYMSVGIPCVASPVGVNQEIVRDGVNGYLASGYKEWEERLLELIKSPELRAKMGLAGRDIAVKEYSLEVNAGRLIAMLRAS